MRAQCCICADLFENAGNINIAAVPCGHTFHEECLMRWLETSSTCPSCRKPVRRNQIIRRLFFDIREEEVDVSDPSALVNELSSLKAQVCEHASAKRKPAEARAQVCEHASAKRELVKAKDAFAARLDTICAEKVELEEQLKKEQDGTQLLETAVSFTKGEVRVCERQLKDFPAAQKRLKRLESFQLLLEGSEKDVSDMLGSYSDGGGEATIKQLSSMVCVVKREYNKSLEEKKALRNHIRQLKNDNAQSLIKVDNSKEEIKNFTLRLQKSNKDVFSLEQENNTNRRKLAHLRSVIKHNKTKESQSFIAAVNEESPNVAYTPPSMSSVEVAEDCNEGDSNASAYQHCDSPDLFDDTLSDESETTQENGRGSQVPLPPDSLLNCPAVAKQFLAEKEAMMKHQKKDAPGVPFANVSVMQKKYTGISNSRLCVFNHLKLKHLNGGLIGSPKTRVCNGLGGSEQMETPSSEFRRRSPSKQTAVKRKPLAAKPDQNQQKLMQRLPKSSSATACTASAKPTANKEPCGQAPSSFKRRPSGVINLFSSSSKGSLSSTSSGSSSSSTKSLPQSSVFAHLKSPSSDFVDLT